MLQKISLKKELQQFSDRKGCVTQLVSVRGKFCEVSQNQKSLRLWKFQLSILIKLFQSSHIELKA